MEYLRFKSEDFKVRLPGTLDDLKEVLLSVVTLCNPGQVYIINDYEDDWVELINYNDPKDIVLFTKEEDIN